MLSFFNFLIRWSFYLLFFLVPIIFTGNTSELFELNKMWLTFGLTLIIAASWACKIISEKRLVIKKTPLDIPILLFLFSQFLSTVFSMDVHTSVWGYYSRFNGGLLSLVSYAFLYVAFVSNIKREDVLKYLYTGIAATVFVALWGLPSHFGYDPTCLVFRGTLDVSCWTFAFQPKVRIFSTLGQPDWLAAYLVMMLPISITLSIIFAKTKRNLFAICYLLFAILFYIDLLFTKSRAGMAGLLVSMGIFIVVYIALEWHSFSHKTLTKSLKTHSMFLLSIILLFLITFLIGTPFSQLDKFTLAGVQNLLTQQKTVTKVLQHKAPVPTSTPSAIPVEAIGGTDSGKIRLFVWQGAWQVFLHNPFFGTGVETFAYAYYQFRPAGHNLTSEWDYLYNKAHNEYLNYLATTGIVGFGTYMVMIFASIWLMARGLLKSDNKLLLLALLASYLSILVTNFFGFSVVIMNIYLFLIPAFALLITGDVADNTAYVIGSQNKYKDTSELGFIGVGVVWIICLYCLIVLLRFWLADTSFAFGQNLDHANDYQAAYSYLHDAVATRPSEPTFQDELSINDAVLSTALFQQKDSANGARLRDEAIAVSNSLITNHPNVITFWKSRVRIFYTLAQVNPKYLADALTAIEKAAQLAPTDAKVWYNLGLLYDQNGEIDHAIQTMQTTIGLKPDYRDAYYALALFYRQKAVGGNSSNKQVVDKNAETKAVSEMHFILTNFGPNDDLKIRDTLKSWGEK